MADSSVTQVLFFIAAITVAASLAGVFISISNEMAQKLNQSADSLQQQTSSEFCIINDPARMPYDGVYLTLYLKNTGSVLLDTRGMAVMLDGLYQGNVTKGAIDGALDGWDSQELLSVSVPATLSPGDHFVKIFLADGVEQSMEFRI
ncbi:MAG TPA: hypothetical protein VMS79_04505 [Methanomassiliicoccales archaeon]|jgi:flagellar protein FlaG|nr:hypothetical protein [Methanomassiliicoccales archaeon]